VASDEPARFSPLWWRSELPEALKYRCAQLVAALLAETAHGVYNFAEDVEGEPADPCIRYYLVEWDREVWLPCRNPVMLRDWVRIHPGAVNAAAKVLLEQDEVGVLKRQAEWWKDADRLGSTPG
jgi:hypothetical protein